MKDKAASYWWKSGTREDVAKGMRLKFADGDPYPPELERIGFVTYVRAAFCYEHEARVRQWKRKAKLPVYRFKKPFPELSEKQKDLLRKKFPSESWKQMPWKWPSQKEITKVRKLLPWWRQPKQRRLPAGWIDIHFWVPPDTKWAAVLDAVKQRFDEQKEFLETRRPRPRNKPYSWTALEVVDRYLNGTAVNDYDKSYARQVLKRTY